MCASFILIATVLVIPEVVKDTETIWMMSSTERSQLVGHCLEVHHAVKACSAVKFSGQCARKYDMYLCWGLVETVHKVVNYNFL
jgi:hypothetical protein